MVFVGQFFFPNIGQVTTHDLRDEQHKKAAFLAKFRRVSLPVCTENTLHHRKVFLLLITERIVPLSSHSINVKAMLSGIIADSFQFSEEDLRRRRAESVRNVKQTNGRISFEKRVRESWEDDDGWQG